MLKIEQSSSSELLRNIYLATPLTTRGQDALLKIKRSVTKKHFLENCYVPPFTTFKNDNDEEIVNEKADPDFEDLEYKDEKKLKEFMSDKNNFEVNFWGTPNFTGLVDSIFIIKGFAGSGKTTYLHYILHEKRDVLVSYICDLEKAEQSFFFIHEPFDIGAKYQKTVWKFISVLLPKINLLLNITEHYELERKDKLIRLTEQEHKNKLIELVKIYKKYFANYIGADPIVDDNKYRSFFKLLEEYTSNDISYEIFGKSISKYFNDIFDRDSDGKESIIAVFGILVRLFFCMSKTQKHKKCKFICAIDNIERYVDNSIIQDTELQLILDSVEQMIFDFTNKLHRIIYKNDEKYNTSFGLLLAMRDTSANLQRFIHFDDPNKIREVNISEWYSSEDIYTTKEKYFEDIHKTVENSPCYIAFTNILSDKSIYKWGLKKLVALMYNRNHRRIANNVIKALDETPEKILNIFNEKWQKAKEDKTGCIKHLCRRLILRILFDNIQKTNYFEDLLIKMVNLEDNLDESDSYARRITTYLHRITINNGDKEIYVSFPRIIKKILHKPYFREDEVIEKQIACLAKVLFIMDKYRSNDTNWAPLVTINFGHHSAYSEDSLIKEMINRWEKYINREYPNILDDVKEFGIKLNGAGRMYAKITPDYEYFACRYANNYKPLMAIMNKQDCENLLKIIMDNAFKCIDNVIERETRFFSGMGRETTADYSQLYGNEGWLYKSSLDERQHCPQTHPIRVLRNHIGYLQHYYDYLKSYSLDADYDNPSDRKDMCDIVQNTLKKYEYKKIEIENKYPNYLGIKNNHKQIRL